MRTFVLLLLMTLLVPRLADDTSVHVAVCLTAAQQSDGHDHAHHAQMQHENQQTSNDNGFECRHCGDCGVHVGAALTPMLLSQVQTVPSSPLVSHELVHPISRPSQLIRPPLV